MGLLGFNHRSSLTTNEGDRQVPLARTLADCREATPLAPHDLDVDPSGLDTSRPERSDLGVGPSQLRVGGQDHSQPASARTVDHVARNLRAWTELEAALTD